VPVSDLLALLDALDGPPRDPVLAGLVGLDDAGQPVVHPLLPPVVAQLKRRPDTPCHAALLEALTGIWNAAVRGAVVGRLRAQGLPPDDLLLRLEQLSPTLGLRAEAREWARGWMADPTAQDAALVQQCLVRLLLAVRGLAEGRARELLAAPRPTSEEEP
jgi:hypothetical protein